MAIGISEPTVPDKQVRSVTGANGEHLQVTYSAPHGPTVVAQNTLANRKITVSSTAIQLSTLAPATSTHAMISVESTATATDGIRFWEDGNTPNATDGHKLVGGNFYYVDKGLANFRMIRAQAADMTVMVTYFKYE